MKKYNNLPSISDQNNFPSLLQCLLFLDDVFTGAREVQTFTHMRSQQQKTTTIQSTPHGQNEVPPYIYCCSKFWGKLCSPTYKHSNPGVNFPKALLANCGRKFHWIVLIMMELTPTVGFGIHTSLFFQVTSTLKKKKVTSSLSVSHIQRHVSDRRIWLGTR